MSATSDQPRALTGSKVDAKWQRRRDIPLAILAWIGVIAVVLWGASHIMRALLLIIVAALLAYALSPGVKWLQKFIPRPFAIVSMCLITLAILSVLFYFVAATALHQFVALSRSLSVMLTPSNGRPSPLESTLHSFGITQQQIATTRTQLVNRGESFVSSALPLITSILDVLLDTVVVAVITIYLLIDGRRIVRWCRRNLPDTLRPNFLVDTLQRVVGGYIRGQLILATLVGFFVGIGMALFHVPYALLLGVLAFILEFIPILGSLISGLICTLIALTQGIWIALGVLIYFIVVHILEGDIIGPRIVGEAVGLHPIVSIAAVIAGSQLFGIWGALLASPIAGVLQALLVTFWIEWRRTHPQHFSRNAQEPSQPATIDEQGSG
ncbi:AI-2E family transporter [Dictyobacter kobayashii]|uniref:AI-2E family transporter n=1 Tax=Dictyobacter kobayashii TaxID=2014872 RepID=A0A402ANW5_9CHLR|nr:AI-2E family transporter [Dictyobacter kobayashii]GCE20719.1 AI-2E family transporter [Dictyobacter kobayashii]